MENEELKKLEEDLPRLREGDLEKAAKLFQAETGGGCDGKETSKEVVEFLDKVEQSGKWPKQACTTMSFLIPKTVTSERSIVLVLTMIRWCEALRAPEVTKWQHTHRIDWDASDGRNGGTLSVQCGNFCWKFRGSDTRQEKNIRER